MMLRLAKWMGAHESHSYDLHVWDAAYVENGRWVNQAAANGSLNDSLTHQICDVGTIYCRQRVGDGGSDAAVEIRLDFQFEFTFPECFAEKVRVAGRDERVLRVLVDSKEDLGQDEYLTRGGQMTLRRRPRNGGT